MSTVDVRMCFGYLLLLCLVGPAFVGAPLPRYDQQKCDSLSLDDCFKNLQVFLRLTSLPLVTDSRELDKLCDQLIAGYNCSQVLFQNRDCLSLQNKEILPMIVSMAEFTSIMFCQGGPDEKGYLRQKFLENSECLLRQKGRMDCCARKTHITDLPALQLLQDSSKSLPERQIATCCPVSRYIQCASQVAMDCGDNAANFTHEYIRRAAGEPVQAVCQQMPNYPEPDMGTCPEPVPVCSGSFGIHLENYFVVFLLVLFSKLYHHY